MTAEPPASHHHAAESVRRHLVALRGGAPFLSPADATLLVGWLEAGVPVGQILLSLEKAAAKRLARKVRAPLALTHAKRHLRRTVRPGPSMIPPTMPTGSTHSAPVQASAPIAADAPHPLAGFLHIVRSLQTDDPVAAGRLAALAEQLEELPAQLSHLTDPATAADALAAEAIRTIGAFHEASWQDLTPSERQAALHQAAEDLGDVSALLEDAAWAAALEERARAAVRGAFPVLCAASIYDHLQHV